MSSRSRSCCSVGRIKERGFHGASRTRSSCPPHSRSSARDVCARFARSRRASTLTAFSPGGTASTHDLGTCRASARPVSAAPLDSTPAARRCRGFCVPAPAAHSPLSCARIAAAQRHQFDRQHNHHRQRRCHHLPRRRQLFLDDSVLFSLLLLPPQVAREAAWSCEAPPKVAVAAQPRCGSLRAARAGGLRVSGVSTGASQLLDASIGHSSCCGKNHHVSAHFFLTP